MSELFHLSVCDDFAVQLSPDTLSREGFVHLSTGRQLLRTANRWFSQASCLKVLVLDSARFEAELKWEDTHGHGEVFPHLYGAIPVESVRAVAVMERGESGEFEWPLALSGYRSPLLEALCRGPALIEPSRRFPEAKLPERCVLCFFSEVMDALAERDECQVFEELGSEIGATRVLVLGEGVAVCHPGVGGPLAAATLEELIALGCREFLLCGGAGSLLAEQSMGGLVVVESAVRDEGTSHHYLSPEESVAVDHSWLARLRDGLEARGVAFRLGKSWTTDALYRETPDRIARRRGQGCLTVEMELASLLAVARYRDVVLGAVLYCGDDLGSEEWDFRDWTSAHSVRENLFWLMVDLLSVSLHRVVDGECSA